MADPLSISASILTVVAAAVQSTISLRDTVRRYKDRDRTLSRLQDELQDLVNILNQLEEVVVSQEASLLTLLQGPVDRCSKICGEFERAMKTFSGKSKMGLRDWTKMEFMKSDINGFLDTLEGYKSTIAIGLGTCTMRSSKITRQVLEDYHEMIKDTVYGLQLRLQRIDNNVAQLATDNRTGSNTKIDLQDERAVTKQCLRICRDAKSYLESLQVQEPSLLPGTSQSTADHANLFEAQLMTHRALDENREKLAEAIGRLQERLDSTVLGEPERAQERLRLEEEIGMQKQCLEVCKMASNQLSDRKVHTFGELVAEDDSDQLVVTTLADLFDVKKALAKNRSAQLVGSMTEAALIKVSNDRYASRFGALTSDLTQTKVNISTVPASDIRRDDTSPSNQVKRDWQLAGSDKRQDRLSSNTVRKRTSEGED